MMRLVGWAMATGTAGGLALVLAVCAPNALAATGTTCSTSEQIVSATAPGFARQSAGVPVTLDAIDATRVSNAQVTLLVGSTIISSISLTLAGTTTDVTVPAPTTGTQLTVAVAWDQDVGAPAACSGTRILKLPLIPAQATAGDPSQPRLDGSFAVLEKPYNYRAANSRPTWRFDPSCAYFACGVTLQSSQGLKLAMALQTDGLYHGFVRADAADTATSCQVAHFHLATIKNAYVVREDVYVRIRHSQSHTATRISGSLVAVYTPTKAARRQGCVLTERAVEQFTGHS